MGWVEDAIGRGISKAEKKRIELEQEANLKDRFDKEPPVTEELAREFLVPFQAPVLEVIEYLERKDFTVDIFGPDFLHYKFGRDIRDKKPLEMLSLIKYEEETVSSTLNGRTIDLPRYYRAYGVGLNIKSGQKSIGTVTIFPIISKSLHLGGFRYKYSQGQDIIVSYEDYASPVDHDKMAHDLQKNIGNWISV